MPTPPLLLLLLLLVFAHPEERAKHFDQGRRVAVLQCEHLQFGRGARRLVELLDQRGDEVHALGRGRDDDRVGPGVGGDACPGQHARLQLAYGVVADVTKLQRRRTSSRCRRGGALPAVLAAFGGCRLTLNRAAEHRGHFRRHRVLEREHADLVDRRPARCVDPSDQGRDLHQLPRRGAHDQRVGSHVGDHQRLRRQRRRFLLLRGGGLPRLLLFLLILLEKLIDHRLGVGRRGVFKRKDFKVRRRQHRQIEPLRQVDRHLDVLRPAHQQQRVRFDQRRNAHLADPRPEHLLIEPRQQRAQRPAVDVLQRIDFDGRRRHGAELFDLLDDLHHPLDVAVGATEDDDVEALDVFDLHGSQQLARRLREIRRVHRRLRLRLGCRCIGRGSARLPPRLAAVAASGPRRRPARR